MSHTPGPWRVLTLDDGTEWIQAGCVRIAIVDDSAGCQPGNAALIAAAPEMLEVLERIRDESGPFNLGEMRKLVESAIRKARGGE